MLEREQKIRDPHLACHECRGYGMLVHFPLSVREIEVLAKSECKDFPVTTYEALCNICKGTGLKQSVYRRRDGSLFIDPQ